MKIATRGSELALWQANRVRSLLTRQDPGRDVELVVVQTAGDRDQRTPLHVLGGKGVFVKEVQAAVLDGRADIAVHSAKDLPAVSPDGLAIGAIPERGDPRDALVGVALEELRPDAIVATGSVRRRALLTALRPDLRFAELRGNMATRLSRVTEFDAIVVAMAAMDRLGLTPEGLHAIGVDDMIPQVGQGALAVECRVGDEATIEALALLDDPAVSRLVHAERSFLGELGGDCSLPAGAHATLTDSGAVQVEGFLASADLDRSTRATLTDEDGRLAGAGVARMVRSALAES